MAGAGARRDEGGVADEGAVADGRGGQQHPAVGERGGADAGHVGDEAPLAEGQQVGIEVRRGGDLRAAADPRTEHPQPRDGVEGGVQRVGERQALREQRVGDPLAQPQRGAHRVDPDGVRGSTTRRPAPPARRPSGTNTGPDSAWPRTRRAPPKASSADHTSITEGTTIAIASASRPTRPASAAARCRRASPAAGRRRAWRPAPRPGRRAPARGRARPGPPRRGPPRHGPAPDCSRSIPAAPIRLPGPSTVLAPTTARRSSRTAPTTTWPSSTDHGCRAAP